MSDMADVIWEHLEHHGDEYDLDYSRSIRTLSDTLAAALSAAGFGPVQEAQAEAWDECVASDTAWVNPYRGVSS